MPIAPSTPVPERVGNTYERSMAPGVPQGGGPLYFEEGIGTDTDVPNDFALGVRQGYDPAPGRSNHNANVYEKSPEETMSERAHVGSAAWVEAPAMLSDFALGSFSGAAQVEYQEVVRDGRSQYRPNPARITG